jgi:hypothetical protein
MWARNFITRKRFEMEHVCWIADSDMEEEEADDEEGNRPNDCLFSFLTNSSSFVLLLVTATSSHGGLPHPHALSSAHPPPLLLDP